MIKQNHINKRKQCNSQGSTKTLNKSYGVESMDIETNCKPQYMYIYTHTHTYTHDASMK